MQSKIYPVLIISYEMLLRELNTIKKCRFELLVCDEAHRMKNANTKTAKAIMGLSAMRRVALTGTPIQNDLKVQCLYAPRYFCVSNPHFLFIWVGTQVRSSKDSNILEMLFKLMELCETMGSQEFHALVEFVNPGVFGSVSTFSRIYEHAIVEARQPGALAETKELGQERLNELNRMTKLFCLRRTSDINNKYLPPKSEYIVMCSPSPLQVALFEKLILSKTITACMQERTSSGTDHLLCIGALKKLSNHPSLIYESGLNAHMETPDSQPLYRDLVDSFPHNYDGVAKPRVEDSGKLQVLVHLLAQLHAVPSKQRERVVVVSHSTKCLDVIQRVCQQHDFEWVRLEGSTSTTKRVQIVDTFNNIQRSGFVMLLSSKAGGVGLNIVGASRLVMFDIDWNPATDLQAMGRIWRDGQRNNVHIYRFLTTGTIEEKIYQRQLTKQGLEVALDGGKTSKPGKSAFTAEDLKDLFRLRFETSCDTHDLLSCTCCKDDASSGSAKSNLKDTDTDIAELMNWNHFSGNTIASLGQEDSRLGGSLLQGADSISFLFHKAFNAAQPVGNDSVKTPDPSSTAHTHPTCTSNAPHVGDGDVGPSIPEFTPDAIVCNTNTSTSTSTSAKSNSTRAGPTSLSAVANSSNGQ
jgi:DNA repair and recombination protein RAD54B